MVIHIKKWGNSASVRIPAAVLAAAELAIDQPVEVRHEGGRIIIEAVKLPEYDLDEMLARMTPDTFHDEVDFGPPVGNEVW